MKKERKYTPRPLTAKQEKACQSYVSGKSKTDAYKSAYDCSRMKPSSISRKAVELFDNVKLTARIKELQSEARGVCLEIDKEYILSKLKPILDARIDQYVEFNGKKIVFKAFSKLTEAQLDAVESIKQGRNGIELKLHGKSWSIEKICNMLGLNGAEDPGKEKGIIIQNVINVGFRRTAKEDEVVIGSSGNE